MSEVILFGEPMAMFVAKTPGRLHEVEEFTRLLAGAEVNVSYTDRSETSGPQRVLCNETGYGPVWRLH